MQEPKSNERTFQGIIWNVVNNILEKDDSISFSRILQEQNIGVDESRFADGLLESSSDSSKKVLFELKNSNWDATDENLVYPAMLKAFNKGYKYFVTGTPRQLVIYETFKENTLLNDRKLKVYNISNIRNNDECTYPGYVTQITQPLKIFLKDLSDIVHSIKEIQWDSIDKFFVNKLSAYILEGSAEMFNVMYDKINDDPHLKNELKKYLRDQDIFNISLKFDGEEIYNICQLSNYLLYLKIIFYTYLQRDLPELKLKVLEIPEDKEKLNKTLRQRFDDVLKHDFELIFQKNILDDFEYDAKYIPSLKDNVEQIRHLNFKELDADIIGAIYNKLIDNQEQHDRGQHFTNINEVDIVNAFCINKETKFVLDSGCGAGTFIVRAYVMLKRLNPNLSHEELLERLWGIEIATFPAFLATMNLSLLDIKTKDNYPVIIREDFSLVKPTSSANVIFLNASHLFDVKDTGGKTKKVKTPVFDTCVGNPPYIRQEIIEHKDRWVDLAKSEHQLKKVNQQSDLYVYYLMHTSSFLKNGGRLGYVVSSSWLDVSFGAGLQKFLLDNFKIIAVIDNQKVRSFETASINTVILILEKCDDRETREKNKVKFVRVFKDYDELIGNSSDIDRAKYLERFVGNIENVNKTTKSENYHIIVKRQFDLEIESTFDGKYENGNWGAKYLRSPEIYNKILEIAGNKLQPLHNFCNVAYGIKTGANEFFYVKDDTSKVKKMSDDEFKLHFGHKKESSKINWEKFGWYYSDMGKKHYLLERFHFKPLFKSQREADKLEVNIKKLRYQVLVCNESLRSLRKVNSKLVKYIEEGESSKHNFDTRPTCAQRIKEDGSQDWFNLGEDLFIGDFIFPSKIGEKFRLIDNRKTKVYCDKVNYNIKVRKEYKELSGIIFIILNSTLFRFLLDLFARQLTGSQTLSDVDVNVVERTLIVDPEILKPFEKELVSLYQKLKSREQLSIIDEITFDDRKRIDEIIFEAIGLTKKDLKDLYDYQKNFIIEREEKSKSVKTSKVKQNIDYETSVRLAKDRFDEIRYYNELIKNVDSKPYIFYNLPATFPKDTAKGDSNFFASYKVLYKDNNKTISVNFENNNQILLYQFFYKKLEIREGTINLPTDAEKCGKILKALEFDFNKYAQQVKNLLKTHRSKAHYISVYREIILH
ncbi:MAG: SAM-dependent DNA methyltransferase [Ignavibacteriaceae bacterium]|nr:SAM-dependent DNA methyltransferase [Ignavibacteriaceae bacterium]HRQ54351.1 N-6 DNA methylase [Ignavibacteriaceae bacterium]